MTLIQGTEPDQAELSLATTPRRRGRASIYLYGIPLLIFILVSFGADLLPLQSPTQQSLSNVLKPPAWLHGGSAAHPLGTDTLGRDMLARLIYGGRLSFELGFAATLAGLVLGVCLGVLAGFKGGFVDAVVGRLVDTQLALPGILLAMSVILTVGRSIPILIAILAVLAWAQYARVVRAETMAIRERTFITRLVGAGVPTWRITVRHILPNIAGTVIVIGTLEVGSVVLAESALSFLGLGVVPPSFSWGEMLSAGQDRITDAWWLCAFPGLAIFIVVILTNLLGDALRNRYDPRRTEF